MISFKVFLNEMDDIDESKIIVALESARNNLKKIIANNDGYFKVKSDDVMPVNAVLVAAKRTHQANKSLSMQKVALESYRTELSLSDDEMQVINESISWLEEE